MKAESLSDVQTAGKADTPAKRYPRYAVGLLLLVYVLHNLDRQIVNILAEPIKHDLGLRDWQLGIMTGLAFALFYATLGIPIARLAERGNRTRIIAIAVATWSAFTAVSGLAQNFVQLVLARIGVGVGEAGCTPAAHSLISDIVPREKRASALGVYAMGAPIGVLLGMATGGFIADAWGWRAGFFIAAAPGLAIGLLVALTLNEPRKAWIASMKASDPAPSFADAMRELRSCRTFWLCGIGSAFQAVVALGHSAFLGSFFFRNHTSGLAEAASAVGLQTASFLGLAIGLINGLSGMVGAYVGGKLGDRHVKISSRGIATQLAVCNFIAVPTYIAAMLLDSTPLALAALVIPALCYGMTYGPLFSVFQSVVQPHTRATGVSIYLLMTNLVGLGLGPLLVGLMSDYFADGIGLGMGEGLRWAQIVVTFLGLVAAALYWRARRHIVGDTVG